MKKSIVSLGLTLSMIIAVGTQAMAGTIGVTVSPGNDVQLKRSDFATGSYNIQGEFGLNNKLLLWAAYDTESRNYDYDQTSTDKKKNKLEQEASPSVGLKYVIVKNVLGVFKYQTADSQDKIEIGAHAKKALSTPLAIAVDTKYIYTSKKIDDPNTADVDEKGTNTSGQETLVQAEYNVNKNLIGYGGVKYAQADFDGKSVTTYIVGATDNITKAITLAGEYNKANDDSDKIDAKVTYNITKAFSTEWEFSRTFKDSGDTDKLSALVKYKF